MPIIAFHELTAQDANPEVYNGGDVLGTYEIMDKLENIETTSPIYEFLLSLQGLVIEMMLRGWRVDPYLREKGIRETRDKLAKLSAIIDAYAAAIWDEVPGPSKTKNYPQPTKLNPESTAQLQRFFYQNLGIPPVKKWTKDGIKLPMDRKALEKIGNYIAARPIVSVILLYRDLAGILEVLETQVDNDWRMRTSYNIGGTVSYRFSSSKSTLGTGANLQNITADLRHMFIADEGWKLYGVDKEQAESRELGFLCGVLFQDWSYLDACESGDLHTYVSRLVWPDLAWTGDLKTDRKLAEMPYYRHFTRRDQSKRLGHGCNYLGTPDHMASEVHIPVEFVREFLRSYFQAFPCIPRFHQWVAAELQRHQKLTNAFGVERNFFDRPTDQETIKAAVAHMPQSATALDLNLGMYRMWKYMGKRIRLMGQLHDAIYFQAREGDDEVDLINEVKNHTKVVLRHKDREFSVPIDVKGGWSWGNRFKPGSDGKLIEVNPRGLDKLKLAA
jgi:DNA polymerase I-like protein with 3'-5' exonuclease and polymerase domains